MSFFCLRNYSVYYIAFRLLSTVLYSSVFIIKLLKYIEKWNNEYNEHPYILHQQLLTFCHFLNYTIYLCK